MREDLQEKLEGMFPKGMLIIYVTPDESINYYMNNPLMVEQLFQIKEGLDEFAEYDD